MKNKKREEEISASVLLQKIKSEEINPRELSPEEKKACINLLIIGEGFTHAQTAQLLCCSEKTIQRYIGEIRKQNSLNPSFGLAKQLIGEMVLKAEAHIAHLIRLSRGREGSVSERAQSEFLAWKVRVDFMSKLQSFGYLPLVAQRFEGDLVHHFNDSNDEVKFDDLKNALNVIETTAKEAGTFDAQTEEKIKFIKSKIEKAEIEEAVIDLNNQNNKTGEESHEEK